MIFATSPAVRAWLGEPAGPAAARMTLHYLETSREAARRLEHPADSQALHDFRVALRRACTCLSVYRDVLGRVAARPIRTRFKYIFSRTDAARDAQAKIACLEARHDRSGKELPPALKRVTRRLRSRVELERRDALTGIIPMFWKVSDTTARDLRAFHSTLRISNSGIGAVFNKHLSRFTKRLNKRIARIHSISNTHKIHKARIACKRLRYLIEPFQHEIGAGRATLERLHKLQDILGAIRDIHGLEKYLNRYDRKKDAPRIKEFQEELDHRKQRLFNRFESDQRKGRRYNRKK